MFCNVFVGNSGKERTASQKSLSIQIEAPIWCGSFFFFASFKHWKDKGEKAKDSLNLVLIEI